MMTLRRALPSCAPATVAMTAKAMPHNTRAMTGIFFRMAGDSRCLGCCDTNDDVLDPHFFTVLFRSAAIHHQKTRSLPEGHQRVMPGVAPIIHALTPRTQKC